MLQHGQSRIAGSSSRPKAFTSGRPGRASLQVRNALTRQRKEEIVADLKEKLEDSVIVFGMRFKGLDVPTVQRFRKGLPEKSKVKVTKNSLMRAACQQVDGWSTVIEKGCQGENAWVFVHEDDISDAVKFFNKFTETLEKEAKAAAPKGVEVPPPTEVTCVVMDNKYLTPAEFKRCESLPNKTQLITTIARMIKQPAKKIAVGVAAVPRKIAYGVKALAELDEDKSKVVGDVAKPKEA
ncbi:large subunit ribosomal protein L10 [Monoraphidium neglectum]|uniref:Large subunit ribosomal protein L10 n=1 Tax=Monoraphidium neglectum TaxID=145388 RepID=A0A0D2MSL1_9CHLO|nr:large subunit ribosomal protein L10 [Monoraphidium neglectum]KIZ03422.1 large subunit ribosomal protein L10 [Monoraphidium neglectum]|eukprot:XP_013902441.1 large subunit ribosomal protein L10 [Monoraphidium neglectum]